MGSTMQTTKYLNNGWRATTALCVITSLLMSTASYAAEVGRSSWDTRAHPNPYLNKEAKTNGLKLQTDAVESAAKQKKNPADSLKTESPIKHVIVLIGENRGLDHTFGVYRP